MRFLWLLLSTCLTFGQKSPVPYAPHSDGPGPTFTVENGNVAYPGNHPSIQSVDFRNLTLRDGSGRALPLRNGHYKHDEPGDVQVLDLDSIYYLGNRRARDKESALLVYSWFAAGGSSSQGGIATVFTGSGGRLRSV